jgi:uncharacterized protein (TIGR01777 family)
MDILVTGGSGFIGSRLCQHLVQMGHRVLIHTRGSAIAVNNYYDVIINLAGHSLVKNRWSPKVKQLIYESRLSTTRNIIDYIKNTPIKPKVFISGSAIGYYESENTFSHKLCADWENEALKAKDLGVRVCLLRTGIVLGKKGGALATMVPPFKLGLGAQLGDGHQWMSWIHMDDVIGIITYLIEHNEINGPINMTSPNPVNHREFVQTLAKILHRPCLLKFPKGLVRILFGEMAEELLLKGEKILPDRIIASGYKFKFMSLSEALKEILVP